MQTVLKVRTAVVAGLMVVGLGSTAQAQVGLPGNGVWQFFGNCVDCAEAAGLATFPVTASLTLKNYTQGDALNIFNLELFVYGGSNLIPGPFTRTGSPSDIVGMTGTLVNGGLQRLFIGFLGSSQGYYQLNDSRNGDVTGPGLWSICVQGQDCSFRSEDFGSGSFNLPVPIPPTEGPPTTTVPEPGTYALLASGLIALGFVSRRKHRAR